MEGILQNDVERVRLYLEAKEVTYQRVLVRELHMALPDMNRILDSLERDGIIEKEIASGFKRNDVKISFKKQDYTKITEAKNESVMLSTIGKVSFDSPCFLCRNLETCGPSTAINQFNCPKLNEWISKPI